MSRRYAASGVSDRNAMLSAYGYGNYAAPQQQPPMGRTASPFEQPYASTSSSSTTPPSLLARHTPSDPYSEYDRKKYDEQPTSSSSSQKNTSTPPHLPTASSWWMGPDRQAEQLEEQNDQRIQGLSDRVRILKDITLGIGNEVRDGTKELGTLGEVMSGAGALLGGTFSRMNKMARRQGGWFWNMMMFLLFVCWLFVFLWWWRR